MLDYECIKNHERLIAVDLSRQKGLEFDPKEIRKIEFVGQSDGVNADDTQFMFNAFIKNQRSEIKIFTRKCNSLEL